MQPPSHPISHKLLRSSGVFSYSFILPSILPPIDLLVSTLSTQTCSQPSHLSILPASNHISMLPSIDLSIAVIHSSSKPSIHPSLHPAIYPATHPAVYRFLLPFILWAYDPAIYQAHLSNEPSIQSSIQPASHLIYPSSHPSCVLSSHPASQSSIQPASYPSILAAIPAFASHPSTLPVIHLAIHSLPSLQPYIHLTIHPSSKSLMQPAIHLSIVPSIRPDIQPVLYPGRPCAPPINSSNQRSGHPYTKSLIYRTIRSAIYPAMCPSVHIRSHPSSLHPAIHRCTHQSIH